METKLLTPTTKFTDIDAFCNVCLRRSTNFSTTSDDTNSRPLPWFACNRLLEKGTLSFRLKDPAGGKTKCGTDVVRYVNGDGSSCRPVSALTASEHPCFGCNRTPDEVSLADSMGDDTPSFIFGENGFFKDRAERVGDVRDLLVANRAKARSQDVTSPKKPNTRSCSCPVYPVRISASRITRATRQELTTRDEYLATRFTKLSASGHDLTPLTQSETQEAASHLSLAESAALFEDASGEKSVNADRRWRDHSFATPCDDEHLLEERHVEEGVTFVSCARSRVRVGTVADDPESPSGRRCE
eukprot:jgi/Undpi1/13862/HiC_scaffold_9.g03513.m1